MYGATFVAGTVERASQGHYFAHLGPMAFVSPHKAVDTCDISCADVDRVERGFGVGLLCSSGSIFVAVEGPASFRGVGSGVMLSGLSIRGPRRARSVC